MTYFFGGKKELSTELTGIRFQNVVLKMFFFQFQSFWLQVCVCEALLCILCRFLLALFSYDIVLLKRQFEKFCGTLD